MLKDASYPLLGVLFAVWLGALSFNALAVDAASRSSTTPAYFRHVSVQQGLSQVTVADILQDNNGFMWFATQNGINRYDGYEFTQYKRDKDLDGSGPIGDYAYKLALDKETSDIWVATSGGLSRYIYEKDYFQHYDLIGADGQQRRIVSTVVFDRFNQMWVGTRHGLFSYEEKSDTFSPIKLDISASSWVLDIETDKNGKLLVATTEGLFAITPGKLDQVDVALRNEEVTDIEWLTSGDFWIATAGSGILSMPDGADLTSSLQVIHSLSGPIINSGVNSIKQLSNGEIWVSANGGLTIVKDEQGLTSVGITKTNDANNILSATHMTRTYESQSGLVWQGTWTSGFSIFDPDRQQIDSFTMQPGSWVRGLEKDDEDNVWFGAPNGIWKRNLTGDIEGPWLFPSQLSGDEAQAKRYIRTLAFDKAQNHFWVGTTSGLYLLREESKVLQKLDVLEDISIFFLDTDPQGDLWVGTFNHGLYWLDAQSLMVKGHWAVPTVTHFHVATDTIYVGTIEGLTLIDKRSKALLNLHDQSRPNGQQSPRVVTWISKVGDGKFLLGTQGSGIYTMTVDSTSIVFESMFPESHLATLSIGGIELDGEGNIWASTTEGLAKIDNNNATISYYDKRNGAYSEGYYINHGIKLDSGEIIFAGPKGMSFLDPEKLRFSEFRPYVVATKLLVLNKVVGPPRQAAQQSQLDKPIYIADKIRLSPEDNVFSVEFSSLDYSSPDSNQYQYQLEGFDKDWVSSDAKSRVATYTNLDPGRYVLKIKGSNKDGVWSDKVKSIEIVVEPHWYWNTWSRILWVLIVVGAFTLFYKSRTWALKARSEKLEQLVQQRTTELEESNLKLLELSTMDELTGLKNRRGFSVLAEAELERFKRTGNHFSVLMLDIDNFKQINDKHGHAAGDAILADTAKTMSSLLRKQDHIARWGGEEFIILAVDTPIASAVILAEKIRARIQDNEIDIEGRKTKVTVTIGVSQIQSGQSLEQCTNHADKNLYNGKQNGRNRVCQS